MKALYTFAAAVIFTVLFAVSAFAENYSISDCSWDDSIEGKMYATWEKAEDKTAYEVRLYKDGQPLGKYKKTSSDKLDFAQEIMKKGIGYYNFVVYPEKGGETMAVTSPVLHVDTALYVSLRHGNFEEEETVILADDHSTILTCNIYLIEKAATPGELKDISVKYGSYSKVNLDSISKPYEDRQPGEKVTMQLTVTPKKHYRFADNVVFKCSKADIKGLPVKNEDGSYTIIAEYIPSVRLGTVSNAYLEDGKLYWDKVKYAQRYILRFFNGDEIIDIAHTGHENMDISSYIDKGCTEIKITANGSSGKTYISPSPILTFDVENYEPEGWQFRKNHWYYYEDGEKCDPGWFEDYDGNMYFFDDKSRMKTGWIKDDGERYFLNDGTVEGVPYGALVKDAVYGYGK